MPSSTPISATYQTDSGPAWAGAHTLMLIGALVHGPELVGFLQPAAPSEHRRPLRMVAGSPGTLVRVATSLYGIPYFAVGADLSGDYHEAAPASRPFEGPRFGGHSPVGWPLVLSLLPDLAPGIDPKLRL